MFIIFHTPTGTIILRQLDIFKERHCWEQGYKGSCKNEIKYSTFDNTGREEPEHVDFFLNPFPISTDAPLKASYQIRMATTMLMTTRNCRVVNAFQSIMQTSLPPPSINSVSISCSLGNAANIIRITHISHEI